VIRKMQDYSEFMFPGSENEYEQSVMREENKRAVWLTASKYLKTRGDIEDIMQETFIFAYFYYGKLEDKSKLKAWLCGIARNKSREFIRGSSRESALFDEMSDLPDLSTPESIYIEREDKEHLQKIISELPEETAKTVRLRYFEGKSIEEIAQILEIKPGTVKSRLHNARNKLELKLREVYTMPENINSIIKESIRIAKEKISQEIAKIEQKENYGWGDFWDLTFGSEKRLNEQNPEFTLSEQDELIRERYEKSIESLSKKNDFEGISIIYDDYSYFEYEHKIGDYGLAKMLKAAEYAEKAKNFANAARFKGEAEIIKKTVELNRQGKELLKCRDGAVTLKKYDKTILPGWFFGRMIDDRTDFNIFGMLFPLYDLDWVPDRNGWQSLKIYKDSDYFEYNGDNSDNRVYKILFSKQPETVKIGDKIYEGCLHVIYRRELEGEVGDRFFARYTTDSVWYAPDVGIIKVKHTTPMDEKATYYLDDYKINGEGMGNKYMPLAKGNRWSYKAEGDNVVDLAVYDYINKFTVTHADGDEAAVSHLGWIYER